MKRRTRLKRRKRLNPVSKRRQTDRATYMRLREKFLSDRPVCDVWCYYNKWHLIGPAIYNGDAGQGIYAGSELIDMFGAPPATEVHHVNGRNGTNYLDVSTWMAVCHVNHRWIEENKSAARQLGFLGQK